MAVKNTKSEWRARIALSEEFDGVKQIWPKENDDEPNYPYNKEGIRGLGGKLKDSEDEVVQSIRFSTKKPFGWNSKKIKVWMKKEGHPMKMLIKIYSVDGQPIYKRSEHMIYITSTEEFKMKVEKGKDNKRIITGVISSDQIDKHGEIVSPAAVMESKEDYLEFPTIRNMHEADQIGKALDLWREGNKIYMEAEIFDDEDKIWHRIEQGNLRAFSIGFRVLDWDEYCPDGIDGECYLRFTEIMLVEVSVVDSPANTDAVFEVKKQLKAIGGDALVNKLFIKVEKDNKATSNIGDGVEENIETTKGETMEDEKKTEEVEDIPVTEEPEAESEETESDPVDEKKEEAEEKEEEFVAAEEDEKETEEPEETEDKKEDVDETKSEMITIKEDIKSLQESVKEIKNAVESLLDKKLSKIKELMEENEKLEKQVEEKKLPKRHSFKDKEDVHDDVENKESKLQVARDTAVEQIERMTNKRLVKRR